MRVLNDETIVEHFNTVARKAKQSYLYMACIDGIEQNALTQNDIFLFDKDVIEQMLEAVRSNYVDVDLNIEASFLGRVLD